MALAVGRVGVRLLGVVVGVVVVVGGVGVVMEEGAGLVGLGSGPGPAVLRRQAVFARQHEAKALLGHQVAVGQPGPLGGGAGARGLGRGRGTLGSPGALLKGAAGGRRRGASWVHIHLGSGARRRRGVLLLH
jgi:hypothetical protein